MAKQGSLKGPGTTGNIGASQTGARYKRTGTSKSGGSSMEPKAQNLPNDGQGRSSSTLKGSRVFRTKPKGATGGMPKSGVPRAHDDYGTKLIGDIYKSTKPKRK